MSPCSSRCWSASTTASPTPLPTASCNNVHCGFA
jgi:hypothetical protein